MNIDTIKPILKWPGGKDKELPIIFGAMPAKIGNYYEPFLGGGALYVKVNAKEYFVNDKSQELITFYKSLKDEGGKHLIKHLRDIDKEWNRLSEFVTEDKKKLMVLYSACKKVNYDKSFVTKAVNKYIETNQIFFDTLIDIPFRDNKIFIKEINRNLTAKLIRMGAHQNKKGQLPEEDIILNIEAGIKGAFYMHMRHLYNNNEKYNFSEASSSAVFYFIRNFTYSGMFRYNNDGKFNVPYGGIGYNRNSLKNKIANLVDVNLHKKLEMTKFGSLDFLEFMRAYPPRKDDFVFLDPPYDTEFSTYDKNEFNKMDQLRLSTYLIKECKAKWMLVIKNTDYIYNLYNTKKIFISSFDKTYQVSFMNRNNRKTEHLLITNYKQ